MADVQLSGLDGTNPLGFLAALGVLLAAGEASPQVRMSWRNEGVWSPVLTAEDLDADRLIEWLDDDRRRCIADTALDLTYDGKRDIKPPPGAFREHLLRVLEEATPGRRRSVDWVAAFATDVAVDGKGNTKPTALHFTAGQQQFLLMVRELVEKVAGDDIQEAVFGPWTYVRPLPVLGWDATASRDYALRASDPSQDKKLGVPGADWLAVRGLAALPVFPRKTRAVTACTGGGWKDGWFEWPLWRVPTSVVAVRTLLLHPPRVMNADERAARGIAVVLRSGIRRSDQGGYGSMEPASVV